MDKIKFKRNLLLIATVIYIISSATGIISAWIMKLSKPLYLGYTVSVYVGMQKWTSAVYFVGICMIIASLMIIICRTKLNVVQRLAYFATLLFLLGLAWLPVQFNQPERFASKGHQFFSNAFFVAVIITLILLFIFHSGKKQRIYSVCGVLFGIFYVVCYATSFKPFVSTILIWETTLIYFYIGEYLFLIGSED